MHRRAFLCGFGFVVPALSSSAKPSSPVRTTRKAVTSAAIAVEDGRFSVLFRQWAVLVSDHQENTLTEIEANSKGMVRIAHHDPALQGPEYHFPRSAVYEPAPARGSGRVPGVAFHSTEMRRDIEPNREAFARAIIEMRKADPAWSLAFPGMTYCRVPGKNSGTVVLFSLHTPPA